jgi:hypothetical protein
MDSARIESRTMTRFREYLYALVQRCSRHGVNLMMSIETTELFGATRLSYERSTRRGRRLS